MNTRNVFRQLKALMDENAPVKKTEQKNFPGTLSDLYSYTTQIKLAHEKNIRERIFESNDAEEIIQLLAKQERKSALLKTLLAFFTYSAAGAAIATPLVYSFIHIQLDTNRLNFSKEFFSTLYEQHHDLWQKFHNLIAPYCDTYNKKELGDVIEKMAMNLTNAPLVYHENYPYNLRWSQFEVNRQLLASSLTSLGLGFLQNWNLQTPKIFPRRIVSALNSVAIASLVGWAAYMFFWQRPTDNVFFTKIAQSQAINLSYLIYEWAAFIKEPGHNVPCLLSYNDLHLDDASPISCASFNSSCDLIMAVKQTHGHYPIILKDIDPVFELGKTNTVFAHLNPYLLLSFLPLIIGSSYLAGRGLKKIPQFILEVFRDHPLEARDSRQMLVQTVIDEYMISVLLLAVHCNFDENISALICSYLWNPQPVNGPIVNQQCPKDYNHAMNFFREKENIFRTELNHRKILPLFYVNEKMGTSLPNNADDEVIDISPVHTNDYAIEILGETTSLMRNDLNKHYRR